MNTGIRHNLRLHLMEFRIQNLMPDSALRQQLAQLLAGFDGDGTHQYRLSLGMGFFHRFYDSSQLLLP